MGAGFPDELLAIAVDLARRAADTAARMRAAGVSAVATKSTATDVVTAADRAVEREIVETLHRIRPQDTVLGEEYGTGGAGAATGPDPVRWIVDPIDGTVNYLYGLPHYAVSIAAEVAGVVVAGVVRNPATGDEWTAVRGGGAYRDGRRLTGSTETDLRQALVGTGFGYDPARRAHQAAVLAGLITQVRDIRRFGAAAIDLCLAAEGAVDVCYEKGLNAWDDSRAATEARPALTTVRQSLRDQGYACARAVLDLSATDPPPTLADRWELVVRESTGRNASGSSVDPP
ncbi:inositol monophosphatase family protein [Micromonospora zhanjiangensis]